LLVNRRSIYRINVLGEFILISKPRKRIPAMTPIFARIETS
jgi:hypothetical protein